jgi:hypothetical protein
VTSATCPSRAKLGAGKRVGSIAVEVIYLSDL